MSALVLAGLMAGAGAARTQAAVLAEFDAPQFVSAGARPCVLQRSFGEAAKRTLRIGQFASLEDSAGELQEWTWVPGAALDAETEAAIAAACGETMRRVAGLAIASCRSDSIAGLRAYLATFAGDLPRRFAEVVELGAGPPEPVAGAFLVGGRRRDLLLLRAPVPETGKFRHSLLAQRWLAFAPEQRVIRLQTAPGSTAVPAATVAVLRGGRFRVQGTKWQGISLARDWPGDAHEGRQH